MSMPTQSRNSELDLEKYSGNRFQLVIDASKRAYELRRGGYSYVQCNIDPFSSAPLTALIELTTK